MGHRLTSGSWVSVVSLEIPGIVVSLEIPVSGLKSVFFIVKLEFFIVKVLKKSGKSPEKIQAKSRKDPWVSWEEWEKCFLERFFE